MHLARKSSNASLSTRLNTGLSERCWNKLRRIDMNLIEPPLKSQFGPSLDVERVRADFPILKLHIEGKPLVYLDNAASSQMPQPVIDRLVHYQTAQHANINRGVHYLSELATAEYEDSRRKLQSFINAR